MANILDKLHTALKSVESGQQMQSLIPKSSSWLSRKLLVTLAVIGGILWLGKASIMLTIHEAVVLAAVYLISQCIQDVGHSIADAYVRGKLIEGASKDGLDAEEQKNLGGSVGS